MLNEDRLISATALQRRICGARCGCEYEDCGCEGDCTFDFFISNATTVDAVEVVHGRWEQVDHDGSWRVDRCSICHRRMHYVDYDQPYQYCPNCSAKMDGRANVPRKAG